jgi:hypothetical protein
VPPMRVAGAAPVCGLLTFALTLALPFATQSCASTPPPRWAEGGSSLEIPRARWERVGQIVDIMPDGHVLIDGTHAFSIDVMGRVIDTDNSPIALLEPEGRLLGASNARLGNVGLHNAAPPKVDRAWLSVAENGEVTSYNDEGDPSLDGKWTGCGPAIRACTLATQIVTLVENRKRNDNRVPPVLPGPTMGFGSNGMSVHP